MLDENGSEGIPMIQQFSFFNAVPKITVRRSLNLVSLRFVVPSCCRSLVSRSPVPACRSPVVHSQHPGQVSNFTASMSSHGIPNISQERPFCVTEQAAFHFSLAREVLCQTRKNNTPCAAPKEGKRTMFSPCDRPALSHDAHK